MLFVAGGVGAAPVYPQVKWMHEHGIDVDVIVGAKTKDMLILEDEMRDSSRESIIRVRMTVHMAHAGMVTTIIEELAEEGQPI